MTERDAHRAVRLVLATAVNWLLIAGLLIFLYEPERFSRPPSAPAVPAERVEASRREPAGAREDFLASSRGFWELHTQARSDYTTQAAEICSGRYRFGTGPPVELGTPPRWSDLERLSESRRITAYSLYHAEMLLQAHSEKGLSEGFDCARTLLTSWVRWSERATRDPLLWYDFATAERVRTLARFWVDYRSRPEYDPDTAGSILRSAAMHAAVLSDPRRFAFNSNHGFMQNVALLQLAAYFPEVVDRDSLVELATSRLDEQFSIVIAPSGLMLEHSPGYHDFAVRMVESAIRHLELLEREVPDAWRRMLSKMQRASPLDSEDRTDRCLRSATR